MRWHSALCKVWRIWDWFHCRQTVVVACRDVIGVVGCHLVQRFICLQKAVEGPSFHACQPAFAPCIANTALLDAAFCYRCRHVAWCVCVRHDSAQLLVRCAVLLNRTCIGLAGRLEKHCIRWRVSVASPRGGHVHPTFARGRS